MMGVAHGAALANDAAEESEKLVRRGIELRRGRDDEAAAREFERAYKLYASPRAAGQLGLSKQALGLWEEAERFVAEALRAAGSDPWVKKYRGVLDEALGTIQKHLGRIEVIGDPEGAEVAMNGRRVGKLPLGEPVRVSEGGVDIDVRAPGYSPGQRTVTLVGGQYQRVVFHLAKVGAAAADATAAVPVRPKVDAGKVGPSERNVASSPPADERGSAPAVADTAEERASTSAPGGSTTGRRALEWTAAGLAMGGLVTGIVGTALHSNNVDKFNTHPCRNNQGSGVRLDGTPDPECQSMLETFRADRTVAIVGFAAAGALTAAWLALVLTEPPRSTSSGEQASRWPVCGPDVTRPGLSCLAHF